MLADFPNQQQKLVAGSLAVNPLMLVCFPAGSHPVLPGAQY
jgi:hypothetical protein